MSLERSLLTWPLDFFSSFQLPTQPGGGPGGSGGLRWRSVGRDTGAATSLTVHWPGGTAGPSPAERGSSLVSLAGSSPVGFRGEASGLAGWSLLWEWLLFLLLERLLLAPLSPLVGLLLLLLFLSFLATSADLLRSGVAARVPSWVLSVDLALVPLSLLSGDGSGCLSFDGLSPEDQLLRPVLSCSSGVTGGSGAPFAKGTSKPEGRSSIKSESSHTAWRSTPTARSWLSPEWQPPSKEPHLLQAKHAWQLQASRASRGVGSPITH